MQAGAFFSPRHVAKQLYEPPEDKNRFSQVDKALKALAAAGRLREVPPLPGGGPQGPKRVFTLASTSEADVRCVSAAGAGLQV